MNDKDKESLNMVERTTQIITSNCARIKFTQAWFIIITSVCPVHNAQVCYFNNVWFMFLVFF
jgi:hypothetical protein